MLEVLKTFFSCAALIVSVYAYGVIIFNDGKLKKSYKDIIIFILVCILNTVFFIFLEGTEKTLFTCLAYFILIKFCFNIGYLKSFFSTIIYALLTLVPDLFVLMFSIRILGISKEYYYSTFAGSILGNLIVSVLLIVLIYLLRKPLKKIINYKLSGNMKIVGVSLLTLITITIFFYNLINNYRRDNSIIMYLLVIATLIAILFYLFKQKIDNETMFKKYDDLLTVMRDYESDIEEQRTINHETKNELLTIRSKLSDKKDKDLCEYVDSIIGDKKSIKSAKFSKFKYLPSNGLKGFLYYKFLEAEQKDIKVSLNISKQIENSQLEKMKTRDFKDLTRIIGVYMDNAIEAASVCEDKQIGLEIYLVNDIIKIIISNSYNYKVDEEKVGKEKYSTKGKNRGQGLLLVKRILNENNRITSETKITDKLYIQTIKVK